MKKKKKNEVKEEKKWTEIITAIESKTWIKSDPNKTKTNSTVSGIRFLLNADKGCVVKG